MQKKVSKSKASMRETRRSESGRSASYLELGRVNQKLRTRDALVDEAVKMVRNGQEISVADVADAARVSRTTAYRYFPTSEMLAAQAALAAYGQTESQKIDDIMASTASPERKVEEIMATADAMVAAHETLFRSLIRFTVDIRDDESKAFPHRPSIRRKWMETALSDVKADLGTTRFNRLTAALCLLCGIESFIVLNDVCQVPADEALRIKRWAGQLLLKAALAEASEGKNGNAKAIRRG